MANKIKIDNQELLVLLEFEDSEYKNIIMCLDENNIVTDKIIIDKINKKYSLELPDELKGIIF